LQYIQTGIKKRLSELTGVSGSYCCGLSSGNIRLIIGLIVLEFI